jgi:hypothetical protein
MQMITSTIRNMDTIHDIDKTLYNETDKIL